MMNLEFSQMNAGPNHELRQDKCDLKRSAGWTCRKFQEPNGRGGHHDHHAFSIFHAWSPSPPGGQHSGGSCRLPGSLGAGGDQSQTLQPLPMSPKPPPLCLLMSIYHKRQWQYSGVLLFQFQNHCHHCHLFYKSLLQFAKICYYRFRQYSFAKIVYSGWASGEQIDGHLGHKYKGLEQPRKFPPKHGGDTAHQNNFKILFLTKGFLQAVRQQRLNNLTNLDQEVNLYFHYHHYLAIGDNPSNIIISWHRLLTKALRIISWPTHNRDAKSGRYGRYISAIFFSWC